MNLRAGNASLKRHLIVGSAWGGCIIWYFNTNNPLAALRLLALFAGGIGWAIGYRDKEDEDPGGFQEFVNGFEMGVREVKNKGQAHADALVAMYRQQQERERSLRR